MQNDVLRIDDNAGIIRARHAVADLAAIGQGRELSEMLHHCMLQAIDGEPVLPVILIGEAATITIDALTRVLTAGDDWAADQAAVMLGFDPERSETRSRLRTHSQQIIDESDLERTGPILLHPFAMALSRVIFRASSLVGAFLPMRNF